MTGIEKTITLQQLLEEIKLNRSEITNKIDASEARLLLTVESINEKVKVLEKENTLLKQEIEQLKRENKKNNIVIFGLNISQDTFKIENVCQEIEILLNVHVEPRDINNFYKLGKTENSPVKIEFVSYLKKEQIIKNCGKLKGKNISIVSDQTPRQREETKILRHNLFLARQDKNNICYIKNNKLYINGEAYSPQDLVDTVEEEEELDTFSKLNSAPSTPTATLQTTNQPAQVNTKKPTETSTKKPNTRNNKQTSQDSKARIRNFK